MICTPIGSLSPSVHTGADDHRQTDEGNRLGEQSEVRAHQHFPAIEHERLLPEPRRPARGCRRKQDIDVAKKRQRLGPEPAAEFLRLRDPGARKHRPGDQPVANVGIEVAKSRAQPLEMKRGAFDHGDQIGGRARLFRAGELDHPVRLQCAGDHIDGGDRARVRRSGRNSRRVWRCEALSRPH